MCGTAWEGHATMGFAPTDETITIDQLTRDPYSVYRRLRAEAPVVTVKSIGRTLLTKAADTRAVKDNAALFSNNDPNTPMQRAFQAHTLMRKDGEEHMRERMAMTPTFSPANLKISGFLPTRSLRASISTGCRATRSSTCSPRSPGRWRPASWPSSSASPTPPTRRCSTGARH
jgi:hypothetical protein